MEQERRSGHRGRRIGALLLVLGGVAMAGLLLYLFRRPLLALTASGPEYRALFPSVGGLRPGDEVRYGGLGVGRVRRVRIDRGDPSRIEVVFTVGEDTPMREDTRASILDLTTTITRYLSLHPGTVRSKPLPPGSLVPVEAGPSLEETLTRATSVLERADTLLAAAEVLASGRFFARLDRTTARLDELTRIAARGAERWGPSLERSLVRLDSVTAHANRLLAALDSASPELRTATTEAAGLLSDIRSGARQAGGLASLMRDLTTATDNLARLTARLERDPTALVRARGTPVKHAGPPIRD